MAKSIAFDEIDKAPEEKQRGITIATVSTLFRQLRYEFSILLSRWNLWKPFAHYDVSEYSLAKVRKFLFLIRACGT